MCWPGRGKGGLCDSRHRLSGHSSAPRTQQRLAQQPGCSEKVSWAHAPRGSSSWCSGWLQESCAACQAAPRDQGAGAAAAEGGIRGTDVWVILRRTSKSNSFPSAEASVPDAWSLLVLPVPQGWLPAAPRMGTGQSYRASVPLGSTKRCSTATCLMLQRDSSRFATISQFLLQFTSPLPHSCSPVQAPGFAEGKFMIHQSNSYQ